MSRNSDFQETDLLALATLAQLGLTQEMLSVAAIMTHSLASAVFLKNTLSASPFINSVSILLLLMRVSMLLQDISLTLNAKGQQTLEHNEWQIECINFRPRRV